MMNHSDDSMNWVQNLPLYQRLYNESPHRSLGLACPFEVYFGRTPNTLKNRLCLEEESQLEIEEEMLQQTGAGDSAQFDKPAPDDFKKWRSIQDLIRDKASKASKKAAQNMIRRNLLKSPPSLYDTGETVLVRVVKKTSAKKTGKKLTLKTHAEGEIQKINHNKHRYNIKYTDPNTGKDKCKWFSVNDITSLTIEEESNKQRKAQKSVVKSKSGKSSKSNKKDINVTGTQNSSSFIADKEVGESVLDSAVFEVINTKKLSNDTINLYNTYVAGICPHPNAVTASTYFYPSLDRNSNTDIPVYRKFINNRKLDDGIEKVVIPVHIPDLEHWLLVVLCLLKLSITIYDSLKLDKQTYSKVFSKIKLQFIAKECENCPENLQGGTLDPSNWTFQRYTKAI